MTTATAQKEYILNRETGKIELHFSKDEYQSLAEADKNEMKRFFNFSRYAGAWVSKSVNNHYSAINVAEKLGFTDGGKVGERLSFAEEMERQAERAESRAERYEEYADNAELRAENLQSEFNELRKDWSWLTQPVYAGHSGMERFGRRRQRVLDRYDKGLEEYRKSEYFKERAETARATADQTKLKNKPYLNNKIEECNKNIRDLERNIIRAEETNNEKWLENLLEKIEYEIDKLAYFQNCLDEIGGVEYNKDNIKTGYLVKIRGSWDLVVKANSKTVETKVIEGGAKGFILKYPYAEIQEMKVPEGWTEPKNEIENPFNIGDFVVGFNIMGDKIISAYQVIKISAKMVTVQQVNIENNKPVMDSFKNDKQEHKGVKKDRQNRTVLNDDNYYLYKYEESVKSV